MPLYLASEEGRPAVVRELLKNGTDVKVELKAILARLHYIGRKWKRLLRFSLSTVQMRTPWTSRIGHRCIVYRKLDRWELHGSFSSMV